jgi:hypothetical protein
MQTAEQIAFDREQLIQATCEWLRNSNGECSDNSSWVEQTATALMADGVFIPERTFADLMSARTIGEFNGILASDPVICSQL